MEMQGVQAPRTMRTLAPFIALTVLFMVNLWFTWPGQMTPDSYGQYEMAVTGVYDDHHPPVMSVLWSLLDQVHKGPGLLLLFHLLLLYGACFLFATVFKGSAWQWLYVVMPLIPQIGFYSSMIWKDVGFAFCFLFASALLSVYVMRAEKPRALGLIILSVVLWYGTAVKFQAQFVLPWLLFGVAYCGTNFTVTKKTWLYTAFAYIVFMGSISLFNAHFVPTTNRSHSWQFVKFYDLAALSIYTNELLFPASVQKHPYYSFEAIKKRFTHEKFDDLYFCPDSPLKKAQTDRERQELYRTWLVQVLKHPYLYMMHRASNFMFMVKARPLQKLAAFDAQAYAGLGWFARLQKAAQSDQPSFEKYAGKLILFLLSIIPFIFVFGFLLPFIAAYFVLGLRYATRDPAALMLLVMNGVSITLLLVLFFLSMAGMMRYVYLVVCMTHASHAFAYRVLAVLWKKPITS